MRAEIVLTISIAIMYMSCVLYLQIAFWMPTLASKLWCINTAGRVKLLLTWGQLWLLVCAVHGSPVVECWGDSTSGAPPGWIDAAPNNINVECL